ncbi:RidA/YER057c/UK114 superfamily, group 6 [hydrothermal vent metagenome]|uniref:RidA/YER057c/UK114 superfamily, group 6 n=1 Tax=hydrothermal vent metagenome TaxID=652676 RepID=A0A3B0TTX9_9ZZZZ
MVKCISSGSSFEKKFGYCRAVIDGEMVHVSGTTGYDYSTMELPESAEAQTRSALVNIARTLDQAGCTLGDVIRVRYYLVDRGDIDAVAPVLAAAFAVSRPAATMIIAGLIEEKMKIEIEVTARVGAASS